MTPGQALLEAEFIDGAWYVAKFQDGRTRSHFFVTHAKHPASAVASCGREEWKRDLLPSDDAHATHPSSKVNPRERCAHCWRRECAKARRT